MDDGTQLLTLMNGDAKAELVAVLDAWQEATTRLEQTHEALREEVSRLTDELEIKNRELARKNRLADLGQMATHVAHEVRNALVPVTLYLSLLRRRLADDLPGREIVGKIAAGCTAVDATVQDLLHFTADRDPQRATVAVGRLVEDVLGGLTPQLAAQRIHTNIAIPDHQTIVCDHDMLRRLLLNLALNAIDAMPDGGTFSIHVGDDPEGWRLEVRDTGPGLPADIVDRLFEPFFTTKSAGTGLGLAIVSRIAEVHGGWVTAGNQTQGGACFTVHFPRDAGDYSSMSRSVK